MTDIAAIKAENLACWQKAQVAPGRLAEVNAAAARLCAPDAKAIYAQVEQATSVPWFVVAVIHYREANQNFIKSIAQGDPWNEVSTHVPRGIGPFENFIDAAIFALTRCAPYAAKWTDWSIAGTLTLLEAYNGFGYEAHHEVSPYDWGATTVEEEGKYTGDRKYNSSVWDSQIGCAALIGALIAIDNTVAFDP